VDAAESNQIWQSDMTKIWAGPTVGWAYLVSVIDCCTRESWAGICRIVVERKKPSMPSNEPYLRVCQKAAGMPAWPSPPTTEHNSLRRALSKLCWLGITHRRTAYNHPEGNSYIERFHRSLKEEEVWTAEYRNLQEARASIARWIEEYNHNRPHRGVGNRTPHEAFLSFATVLKNQALTD
jgi:putative transposase